MSNYPVPDPDYASLENEILKLQNRITAIETNLQLHDERIKDNLDDINELDNEVLAIKQRLQDLEEDVRELQNNKVDKRDGYELVKVEDVLDGDGASVANINSLRIELDKVKDLDRITGETTAIDLESCMLKPTELNFATFALDKGTYLITGFIRFSGDVDSLGEAFFEHDGKVKSDAKVLFGSAKYGTCPITALMQIKDDNTTVYLKARRLTGVRLDLISNDKAKSYLTWVKLDSKA